MLEGSLSF